MSINKRCKHLITVRFDNEIDDYSCKKDHFDKHNCVGCEDFECKFFEEDKTMTYEIKKMVRTNCW